MNECNNSTVPLRRAVPIKYTQIEVNVSPEKETSEDCSQWELAHYRRVFEDQLVILSVL